MIRSYSVPSLGASTIGTATTGRLSHMHIGNKVARYRGQFLWEGRCRLFTLAVLLSPFNLWFQSFVILTVVYKFVVNLLLAFYLTCPCPFLNASVAVTEVVFLADIIVHLLHIFWPIVRIQIRVHRRNSFFLAYDVMSLVPLTLWFHHFSPQKYVYIGRWLEIVRIYRLFAFFRKLNECIKTSRTTLYVLEHSVTAILGMHACTCFWYALNDDLQLNKWIQLGYPPHVNSWKLKFDNYMSCWYYCACRFFNVIFGDVFPLREMEKWLTSIMMLFGYVFLRYQFIGLLTWEFVLQYMRQFTFVDRYHHMKNYLKFRGAPSWLVDKAKKYQKQLWLMKDGILVSHDLQMIPLSLRMELIYDINVGHFHSSLLFRDTDEAFMRQISLLMRHELYLSGQHIWSQDVVKSGMICIKKGIIELLSDEDDESPVMAFKEGTVLGELSLFYSLPSKVTVRAATYVEIQVLRRTDFMRVIPEHPCMLQYIRGKITDRLITTRKRQEAITQYDKGDSRLIRTRYRPMKVLKDNLAGVEEEDPTFVDDSHMYYRDENNVRQAKFTGEYLELYQMSSNVTTIDAPRICLRARFPWILEPNTNFTYTFDIGHFLLVLCVCIISPYHAVRTVKSDFEMIYTTVVTACLLLNIYLQLTTAIVDKNVRRETVKEIAEVKMASLGFYLDVLSVFPMSIFTDTLDPNEVSIAGQVVKLLPILQVWHIWDYAHRWMNNFDSNTKVLCLMKYSLLVIISCYWSGCFLYLYACPREVCKENSWIAQLTYWETKVFVTNQAKHEKPLVSAFSFGTAVFTGSGNSDINPGPMDLFVVTLLFVAGTYLSCFYTAKICSLFLLATQRKLKFKDSMREFFYFLDVNHVSSKIKGRVKKFFCVQWYYNNAVSSEEIFNDMSASIQQEVLAIEMVEALLDCPLFQNCNRDFLQTVADNARSIVLPDNEIVQHGGDIGRDMYIIQKGHCDMLNHRGKVDRSIGPGGHFGVVEMLFGLPKVYTVLTSTNCILVHVEYTALAQCWGSFPDISYPINTVLKDPVLRNKVKSYEDAKPLTGRVDAKTNQIAQELKESFVVITGRDRHRYVETFAKLGVMRHIRYLFLPGCITPYGLFLKFWCAVRFILAIYYIIIIPYNIATKQYKYRTSYTWVDVLLYVDIIIMSYVAYYNDNSLLVSHPLLTTSHYLKTSFFLDFVSIFPLEQMLQIVNDNTDMDFYRMNRILLVTRVMGAFSYWESNIMRVNPFVVLIKYLPVTLTLVNFATAIVFTHVCKPYLDQELDYLLANCTRVLVLTNAYYETKYAASEYTNTFYWVFEIFVGCGCTPFSVSNSVDVWLSMTLRIAGFLYFAFMFGYVTSSRSTATHSLLQHTEKTRDLFNFLYQENVDPLLTAKTLKYFEYVWKRTNGSNPQKLCRSLNTALMEDTLVFMYERALREVPLFGKVDRSFIRVITQHLHEMYFLKSDMVIKCRDVQSNIYIIYRGKVDVLTSYNEMITCMGPGGMFGNFSGQPLSCSAVAIYASRSLDLLVISSQTFFNLVKYYLKLQEPLQKAFEISRDYILPITMDSADDSSSESSEVDLLSLESGIDSKSGSSRFETDYIGQLSIQASQSNVSQAKSSSSASTYHSFTDPANILRPGTWLFQGYGYVTCFMATINYAIVLYEITTLNDCLILFWLEAFYDVFFYVKIFMTMHQGYTNKHGHLIMNATKCRRRYFSNQLWLWTDLLVNFPLDIFSFCFPHWTTAIHYLRANKMLRLKYLVDFYRKTAAELTNNLTTLQVVMTLIVIVLLIHTLTCVWLVSLIATSPVAVIRPLKMNFIDEETPQRNWDYATSFYVIVSQLTMTGGDEFVIDQVLPMVILGVCLVCGKMLGATVVATSVQMTYSSNYALTVYERLTGELVDFLKNQGLSDYQLKKIRKYIRQLWVTERGRQLPALLEQTPYVRRCDLMSAMFGHHLRNCYLFSDTGERFLRQLAAMLDYTVFFPGNYIVVAGDCDAKMYWVASGRVSVLTVRPDLTETTHEVLTVGDVFGILQGLNRGIRHCFSYRAETRVSILTLNSESWFNILQFFPEANRAIGEKSEILFAQI